MEEELLNYNTYLKNHKENVLKAFNLLYDYVNGSILNFGELKKEDLLNQIKAHDDSKFKSDEYKFYANYFFGERTEKVKEEFKNASKLHRSRNLHHPEYWEKNGIINMPDRYLFEMICDWWSFYLADGEPEEVFDWYEKNYKKFNFCKENQEKINKMFDVIEALCKQYTGKYSKTLTTTLLFIIKDGKILLGEKKRGFGQGKLNGFGGKLQEGESVEECMLRETMEEVGVKPLNLEKRAVLYFDLIYKGAREKEITHVFVADNFEGEITESEEMKPIWFDIDKLPLDRMFSDDKFWISSLIEGKTFEAIIRLDENFNTTYFNISFVDDKF